MHKKRVLQSALVTFCCVLVFSPVSSMAEQVDILVVPFWIYRNILSPIFHPDCPMSPSCSHFAQEAVAEYGLVKGTVMAASRMLKETPDMSIKMEYPFVLRNGRYKFLDPIEENNLTLKMLIKDK